MAKKTVTKTSENTSSAVAMPAAGAMDIPLELIVRDDEFNARKQGMDEKSISTFADSIEVEGLLQPVVVEPLPDGRWYLKAGFRRHRAFEFKLAKAKEAGKTKDIARWSTIKAMVDVGKGDDEKTKKLNRYFVNIAENVARANITPYDLAHRCAFLKREFGISGSAIAERVGKNVGYINNLLAVLGEGRSGDGVIPEVLKRWEEECSWPDDDKRTKVCTTDELNRLRQMSKEDQLKHLNRELFIAGGGDPEKYDAGLNDGKGGPAPDPKPDPNQVTPLSSANRVKALEAAQFKLKSAKTGEEKARLNGVIEALKACIGVKTGLTNRIRDVIAFKDGKVTETCIPAPTQPAAN